MELGSLFKLHPRDKMKIMKKIGIVTGSRAEYGLLSPLIDVLKKSIDFEIQLYVTGMHLSPEFGLTHKQIEKDGINILKKIEVCLSSDTSVGISKSIGLALISFSEAYDDLKPDYIVVIGDRTETFAAACAAHIAGIPLIHIGGGEVTEGAYDDGLRHAITKFSILHFPSTEKYRERIIQLGENPNQVFAVGDTSIDNLKKLNLLSRDDFEKSINFKLLKYNLLITFHPVTMENNSSAFQFNELLEGLKEFNDTLFIFTKPNSDKNGRILIEMIDNFVSEFPTKAISFISLGQLRYLSALKHVNALVGNSSSGITEAPYLKTPTVNIGNRQKGRIMGNSIFNCEPKRTEISQAIRLALEMDKSLEISKIYGSGNTSEAILEVLEKIEKLNIQKSFYDLPIRISGID